MHRTELCECDADIECCANPNNKHGQTNAFNSMDEESDDIKIYIMHMA